MLLVTGATGLTGQFVVEDLIARGHAVRALCRAESPRLRAAGAEIAIGDLRDLDSLARATRGTTGIVHTACTYTDSAADLAAMQALIDGWQAGPFVFLSSLDVYGLIGGAITEDTPLCETYNDYARGKVLCERLLAAAPRAVDQVALRAPYIWGPHPIARKRLVPARLDDHQPIVLPGAEPAEWRRYQDVWIDVRDLASIVAACVELPGGRPLNVLAGHFVWHDLYTALIEATGSRSAIVHKPLDAIADDELPKKYLYAQTWRFSDARLIEHLGAVPRRSFDESVRDTARTRPTG